MGVLDGGLHAGITQILVAAPVAVDTSGIGNWLRDNAVKVILIVIGLVILIWTLVLTVTIGCIIVWLMKGPAYVADGYDVSHSDKPRR